VADCCVGCGPRGFAVDARHDERGRGREQTHRSRRAVCEQHRRAISFARVRVHGSFEIEQHRDSCVLDRASCIRAIGSGCTDKHRPASDCDRLSEAKPRLHERWCEQTGRIDGLEIEHPDGTCLRWRASARRDASRFADDESSSVDRERASEPGEARWRG
jgi:hypothetical protein